mmetsp:Transcript_72516/g.128111  ORF Transcript_72516/g.128111 Transcript_72516/m.128111 type:complete len:207 (+) Transcript_72516:184-804(+)
MEVAPREAPPIRFRAVRRRLRPLAASSSCLSVSSRRFTSSCRSARPASRSARSFLAASSYVTSFRSRAASSCSFASCVFFIDSICFHASSCSRSSCSAFLDRACACSARSFSLTASSRTATSVSRFSSCSLLNWCLLRSSSAATSAAWDTCSRSRIFLLSSSSPSRLCCREANSSECLELAASCSRRRNAKDWRSCSFSTITLSAS